MAASMESWFSKGKLDTLGGKKERGLLEENRQMATTVKVQLRVPVEMSVSFSILRSSFMVFTTLVNSMKPLSDQIIVLG